MDTKVLNYKGVRWGMTECLSALFILFLLWLSAMTLLNVSGLMMKDLKIGDSTMPAVSIASLFSGLFVVVCGFDRVIGMGGRRFFGLAFAGVCGCVVSGFGGAGDSGGKPMLMVGRAVARAGVRAYTALLAGTY